MADLPSTHLNTVIAKTGPVLVRTPRWVRAAVGSDTVANSKRVTLVREPGSLPVFAFPLEDVQSGALRETGATRVSPVLGPVRELSLTLSDREIESAAWTWAAPPSDYSELANHVAFRWDAIDHWYEEAEEIFRHPRDPFHRVDAIASDRHVRVVLNGHEVADSRRAHLLFETGHPVRFYLPPEDIRMDLLESTQTTSRCPYKGIASYWRMSSDPTGRDIAWAYQDPISECPSIRGLISFFNERVDAIEVDGETLSKPHTSWS